MKRKTVRERAEEWARFRYGNAGPTWSTEETIRVAVDAFKAGVASERAAKREKK